MDLTEQLSSLSRGESLPVSEVLSSQLKDYGLSYVVLDGRLSLENPIELLNAKSIADQLPQSIHAISSRIDIHLDIDSTNAYLMARTANADFHGSICLAEMQTAGRGRRGRRWVSPFGKNIYLSLGWVMPVNAVSVSGLSLVVGMQVCGALRALGLEGVGLKWPNDILYNGGKLSGILIEIGAQERGLYKLVVGVGVNLGMSEADAALIDQPWSALGQDRISRNRLVARLIEKIYGALDDFSAKGFAAYQARWPDYNLYQDRMVRVLMADKVVEGFDRGVDVDGNLLLETSEGLLSFNAGEVSLRPI